MAWQPHLLTKGEAFRTATSPARVGQRVQLLRAGNPPEDYIRTFCGNRWGWVNLATGECIDSANIEYAIGRGASVVIK